MMEAKIILSAILRKFDIHHARDAKDLQLLAELVLRPKNGLYIKFTKRKTSGRN